MGKPLISFIITYYDMPVSMLCECIDSILALSLHSYERELIVIDDGSRNSPINKLIKYGDDIIYIRQSHKGLSEARNAGIQISTATYIQFIDGDDRLLQLPYEHCIDIIRKTSSEMVVFDFTNKEASSPIQYKDGKPQSGSHLMRQQNIHGTACGYLFRRSILGDLRFTPGIFHEDEEFTPLLLLRAEKVIVTNAQPYLYQLRPDSITTDCHIRKKIRRLEDFKGIILRLNIQADRLPIDDRSALQRRIAQLSMDYLYNIIRLTNSRHYLERKIEELRHAGLYPLPPQNYTNKYVWFRKMVNTHAGRSILIRLIPLLSKER